MLQNLAHCRMWVTLLSHLNLPSALFYLSKSIQLPHSAAHPVSCLKQSHCHQEALFQQDRCIQDCSTSLLGEKVDFGWHALSLEQMTTLSPTLRNSLARARPTPETCRALSQQRSEKCRVAGGLSHICVHMQRSGWSAVQERQSTFCASSDNNIVWWLQVLSCSGQPYPS